MFAMVLNTVSFWGGVCGNRFLASAFSAPAKSSGSISLKLCICIYSILYVNYIREALCSSLWNLYPVLGAEEDNACVWSAACTTLNCRILSFRKLFKIGVLTGIFWLEHEKLLKNAKLVPAHPRWGRQVVLLTGLGRSAVLGLINPLILFPSHKCFLSPS